MSYRTALRAGVLLAIPMLVAGAGVLFGQSSGQSGSTRNSRENITSNGSHTSSASLTEHDAVTRCSDLEVKFGNSVRVAHAEQTLTIPRSSAPQLRAHLTKSVGMTVFPGAGQDYSVLACKYAAATYAASSDANLDDIHVTAQGGELTVGGPGSENWMAYLIIQVPADATLDVATEEGPISLRELRGKITAHVQNGPLDIDHCTGDVDGSAVNGPINVVGSSGRLHLKTENGPLSVKLDGNRWESGELEGSTRNGPLDLAVAEGYSSGVVVESRGHSPMSCATTACREGRRTWDDYGRQIELGQQPTVIRLSTENGPVSVTSRNDGGL